MRSTSVLYIFIALLSISCQKDPEIPAFGGKDTGDNVVTTYTTADIDASFINAKSTYTYMFVYSEHEDLSSPSQLTLTENEWGHYIGNLKDLQAGKTYYYKYIVTGTVNSYYSNLNSFATVAYYAADIHTDSVNRVDYLSACTYATLSDWGCEVFPEWGVCYSSSPEPTIEGQKIVANTDGSQQFMLTNLEVGTTYYVRSFANSKFGVTYGNELSFTTRKYVVPTVETRDVTAIYGQNVVCSGNVTFDGGKSVTEKGICYSTSKNPTISDKKVISLTSGVGAYSCLLENLDSKTTYYIRAYAINEKGVGYGQQKQFTTK